MRTPRTLLSALGAAALGAAILTSCATAPAAPDAAVAPPPPAAAAAPATPAAPPPAAPATGPGAAVEAAFVAYNTALGARDYGALCALSAPEARKALIDAVNGHGGQVATCEEAFSAVLAAPDAAAGADEVVRTLHVDGVTVDGDTAKVNWSAQSDGRQGSTTTAMRRVDGRWTMLPATAP